MTQPAFTCSRLTIETLEQGMNTFKVNNKDTRNDAFIVNFEHILHTPSLHTPSVSIVHFEDAITGWE